jgi:hypothetical protein
MANSSITNYERFVSTPKEVANYFGKSLSWVYKNQNELGVRKLKGSLFFPQKEELYERLFCKKEGVEVRLYPQGNQIHGSMVQEKIQGKRCRIKEKSRAKKSCSKDAIRDNPNRHNLFDFGE